MSKKECCEMTALFGIFLRQITTKIKEDLVVYSVHMKSFVHRESRVSCRDIPLEKTAFRNEFISQQCLAS